MCFDRCGDYYPGAAAIFLKGIKENWVSQSAFACLVFVLIAGRAEILPLSQVLAPAARAADAFSIVTEQPLCAPGPAASKERVLNFPVDYSLGQIFIQSYKFSKPYKALQGAARGRIVVPAGCTVKFEPAARFYKNPAIIDTIPPEGIDVMQISASSLDDSEDGLCDRALARIGHLSGLVALMLDRSDATDAGAAHAADLPNLQVLSLFSTTVQGKCLEKYSALKHLTSLRLGHNSIKDECLRHLAAIPNLLTVDLNGCNVTDAGLNNMRGCSNLVSLSLADNPKVTDKGMASLLAMKKLSTIGLRETSVSASGILQLKGLNITGLELPSSRFSRQEMAAFSKAFPKAAVKFPRQRGSVDTDTKNLFAPLH